MREILGAEALLDGPEFPDAEKHARIKRIGGRTDQIQRNIIGERVLGLPRDIEVDRDIPFRQSLAVKSGKL